MASERLQKVLAAAGIASRRKAEELIAGGRVSVNGEVVTELGTKADPRMDEIRVDGSLIGRRERHVYFMLYKPKGTMTTVSDPEGRPTVLDLMRGVKERLFPVGRLDYMSEGLLLMTNDGELMSELTAAGSHVPKTYQVKVSGHPTEEDIDKLRDGIMLPPEPGLTGARGKKQPGVERRSFAVRTQPAEIELVKDQDNPWYEVTLIEGRNRQIRRMFEQIGFHVEKIKRVRYGSLELNVEPGEFRELSFREINELKKSLKTPYRIKTRRKPAAEGEARGRGERGVRGGKRPDLRGGRPERGVPRAARRGENREFTGRDTGPNRGEELGERDEVFERTAMERAREMLEGFDDETPESVDIEGEERPARPAAKRQEYGERTVRAKRQEYGDRGGSRGERPQKPRREGSTRGEYGQNDRPARQNRGFGRGESRGTSGGDRPQRSFGGRGENRDFRGGDRPQRGFGDRDRGESRSDRPTRAGAGEKRGFDRGTRGAERDNRGGEKRGFGDRGTRGSDRENRGFARGFRGPREDSRGFGGPRGEGASEGRTRVWRDKDATASYGDPNAPREERPQRPGGNREFRGGRTGEKRGFGDRDRGGSRGFRGGVREDRPQRSGERGSSRGPRGEFGGSDRPARPSRGFDRGERGDNRGEGRPKRGFGGPRGEGERGGSRGSERGAGGRGAERGSSSRGAERGPGGRGFDSRGSERGGGRGQERGAGREKSGSRGFERGGPESRGGRGGKNFRGDRPSQDRKGPRPPRRGRDDR